MQSRLLNTELIDSIRRAVESTILPNSPPPKPGKSEGDSNQPPPPLFMPAGASIVMVPIVLQRSRAVWGEDAEEFKIDRWLHGLSDQQREAYYSFGAGPRMVSVISP